jgi:VWFA-related protein
MKRASLGLLLIYCLMLPAWAQDPLPTPAPPKTPPPTVETPPDDDDVVRITTNLVQVDVTVTDKQGRIVNDLKPEDFEIYEDGKLQPVTNFSFVNLVSAAPAPPASTPKTTDKNAPAAPPVLLKAEQVRRAIALVVDDLGLSWESTHFARQALKKFVDEQMQPGDLVAIIRTAGGMGALQSFTSDKRQLYAAIERVRWYPVGRGGISAFAPIEGDPLGTSATDEEEDDTAPAGGNRSQANRLEDFRGEVFATGTLGAVNYIVSGLGELPGRKSVVLISDGFRLFSPDGEQNARVVASLNRLTDLANRASVVIYTMDARGLQTLGLTAADNVSGLSQDQVSQSLSDRRDELFETQAGLVVLAERTGGFNIRNNNDLAGGIRKVLEDQRGYYLIGYRPDEATFDAATGRRKFHNIKVKLKRPGLNVRTRTGFYGVASEKAAPVASDRSAQMHRALVSPFGADGVRVRLTAFFVNDAKAGSFLRSILFIDGHDITFVKQPDGTHKAVFDILAYTFGDNGLPIDSFSRTHTLTVREGVDKLIKNGLVYTANVPLKKAGAYQLRVSLRDAESRRVGSASQFIEAPDIKKGRLTLSGVAVTGLSKEQAEAKNPDEMESDPDATPAVRRFRQKSYLNYGFWVYNAKTDNANRPQLTMQIKIFSEGKEIFAGQPQPLGLLQHPDPQRLIAGGRLWLGNNLEPGQYILQVIVTDSLAKGKNRVATQWTDFELVK